MIRSLLRSAENMGTASQICVELNFLKSLRFRTSDADSLRKCLPVSRYTIRKYKSICWVRQKGSKKALIITKKKKFSHFLSHGTHTHDLKRINFDMCEEVIKGRVFLIGYVISSRK